MNRVAEDNRGVVALSYLIRDYMRQTNKTNFSLSDIEKYDTSGRVSNNFSRLEVANWPNVWAGGYAVFFKFSDNRNKDSVILTESEKAPLKMKQKVEIGRNEATLAMKFDGEIHFNYTERHYRIVEIVLRKHEN